MNIYINLEIDTRELDSKILLAVLAADRGHQVIVSDLSGIERGFRTKFLSPGIFHTKSLTPGKRKLEYHQKIIDKGQPEQYAIEKNGVYYLYADIKGINENKGNFFELFEIVDKKYEDAETKELLIMETQ